MHEEVQLGSVQSVGSMEQAQVPAVRECNLALCANDRYYPGLFCAVATAIRGLNSNVISRVYIIDAGISSGNKKQLETFVAGSAGCELHWLATPEKEFQEVRLGNYHKSVLYRLALAELVPNVERLIYLDADVLVFGDLSHLWDLAVKCPEPIMAVQDWEIESLSKASPGFAEALDCDQVEGYLNSGVLVLNLVMLREEGFFGKAISILEQHGRLSRFPDQDVFNCLFAGRWGRLQKRWNTPAWGFDKQQDNCLPYICHFTNHAPWLKKHWSPSQALFCHVAGELDFELEWKKSSICISYIESVLVWLAAPLRAFRLFVRSTFFRADDSSDHASELRGLARYWWLFFLGGPERVLRYRRRIGDIREFNNILK